MQRFFIHTKMVFIVAILVLVVSQVHATPVVTFDFNDLPLGASASAISTSMTDQLTEAAGRPMVVTVSGATTGSGAGFGDDIYLASGSLVIDFDDPFTDAPPIVGIGFQGHVFNETPNPADFTFKAYNTELSPTFPVFTWTFTVGFTGQDTFTFPLWTPPVHVDRLVFSDSGIFDVAIDDLKIVPNPEPGTLVMLGTGLLGVIGFGWRRRKSVG